MTEFELHDHLGDVRVTFSDLKLRATVMPPDSFSLDLLSAENYYQFGMLEPERKWYAYGHNYRYGYNGKEKDDDIKGLGNSYDYGARMYDPRLGRWFKIDNAKNKYPGISPYSFANNNPILFSDIEGDSVVLCEAINNNASDKSWMEAGLKSVNSYKVWLDVHIIGTDYKPAAEGDANYSDELFQHHFLPNFKIELSDLNGRGNDRTKRIENKMKTIGSETTYENFNLETEGQYHLDYQFSDQFDKNARTKFVDDINKNPKKYFNDIEKPTESEILNLENKIKEIGGDGAIYITGGTIKFAYVPMVPLGQVIGHELGGIIEEWKDPIRSWIFNGSGIFKDTNAGHRPENNPHNVGSQKGEHDYESGDKEGVK